MKHRRKLLPVLAALLLAGRAAVLPVSAEPEQTASADSAESTVTTAQSTAGSVFGQYTYEETPGGGVRILSYAWCNELKVSVPTEIGGKPGTEIGPSAFAYCQADDITLPPTLLLISEEAFANCAYITSITVPNGCRYIGSRAFRDCDALASVTVPETVTEMGGGVFDGTPFFLDNTEEFAVCGSGILYAWKGQGSTMQIPDTVRTIAASACAGHTELDAVTIPESVARILEGAFSGCTALRSITVKGTPEAVAPDAFAGTAWEQEGKQDMLLLGDILYACRSSAAQPAIPGNVRIINDSAFAGNESVTAVTLPDSVTEIRRAAFSGCTKLQTLTAGNALAAVGDSAFDGCTALRELRLGSGLKTLGAYACGDCTALRELHLPDSVTAIGRNALGFCYADGTWKRGGDLTLYANAEPVLAYGKEHGISVQPLPESEQTEPVTEATAPAITQPSDVALPEGKLWLTAVISGGALVLLAAVIVIIRRIRRKP